jgi:hypothetical protein
MNDLWAIVLAALWAAAGATLGGLQWRLACRLRHRPNSGVAIYLLGLALSWAIGWTVAWAFSWAAAWAVRKVIIASSIDASEVNSLVQHEVINGWWMLACAGGWSLGRLGTAIAEWGVRWRQIDVDMRFRDWLFLHLFGCWLWLMGYGIGQKWGISVGLSTDSVTAPLLIWAAGLAVVGSLAGVLSILGLREDAYFPWPNRRP